MSAKRTKTARQSVPLHTDIQKLEQWQKLRNQTITLRDLNEFAQYKRPDLDLLAEPMTWMPSSIHDGTVADAFARKSESDRRHVQNPVNASVPRKPHTKLFEVTYAGLVKQGKKPDEIGVHTMVRALWDYDGGELLWSERHYFDDSRKELRFIGENDGERVADCIQYEQLSGWLCRRKKKRNIA